MKLANVYSANQKCNWCGSVVERHRWWTELYLSNFRCVLSYIIIIHSSQGHSLVEICRLNPGSSLCGQFISCSAPEDNWHFQRSKATQTDISRSCISNSISFHLFLLFSLLSLLVLKEGNQGDNLGHTKSSKLVERLQIWSEHQAWGVKFAHQVRIPNSFWKELPPFLKMGDLRIARIQDKSALRFPEMGSNDFLMSWRFALLLWQRRTSGWPSRNANSWLKRVQINVMQCFQLRNFGKQRGALIFHSMTNQVSLPVAKRTRKWWTFAKTSKHN